MVNYRNILCVIFTFLFSATFAQDEMYQNSIFQADSISINELSKINSNANDYSLWVNANYMFFSSTRNPGWSVKYPETKQGHENVFFSNKIGASWSTPETKTLSSRKTDYAIAGMSDNPNIVLVYDGRFGGGEIFLHDIKETTLDWSKPIAIFDKSLSEIRKTSAFFNEKTEELFFTANLEGHTIGGKDIYVAEKLKNNKWGKPKNIGQVVNSQYDEEGLFFHNDTLYFSSKGHESDGKFDIYYTIRENNEWSKPIKLPPPINSADNDISFVIQDTTFYLSSDRDNEDGIFNLYSGELIIFKEIIEEIIEEEIEEEIEIVVKDTISRQFTAREKSFIDILKEIPEEILHYRVQLGAFRFIRTVDEYRKSYPQVQEGIVLEPVDNSISRYLIDEIYHADEPDAILRVTNMQEKVIDVYQITDSFIAAYTKEGKRIVIIWDMINNEYKLLE